MLSRQAGLRKATFFLTNPASVEQRRSLKTLTTRTTEYVGAPIEQIQYQIYNTLPGHAAGFQPNTFGARWTPNHSVGRESNNLITRDFRWWGKTLGQPHLPQRHQRVAFDHYDKFHATKIGKFSTPDKHFDRQSVASGDGAQDSLSKTFDANELVYSVPQHNNRYIGRRRPADTHMRFAPWKKQTTSSTMAAANGYTDTGIHERDVFGTADATELPREHPFLPSEMQYEQTAGRVPGVNAPYLGEPDRMMMESMSVGSSMSNNTVTKNEGRFSSTLYLNTPEVDNTMIFPVMRSLRRSIERFSYGITTKMFVLKAAQSGMTDKFCGGLNLEQLAFQASSAERCLNEAEALSKQLSATKDKAQQKKLDVKIHQLKHDAGCYLDDADTTMRQACCLLWSVFSAKRPMLTLINGGCNNIGNGLALLARYPALRDSSEFVHDGPQHGLTPIGGMTHLLARNETSLKYPGLAEYIMLTGQPLYAGDVLRLGWSDLFSTLPDIDFHIKEWFNNSEHMHNDAVAWQIGSLLDSCFKMKDDHHRASMERISLTPQRAKWIEEVFADQTTVPSVMKSLSLVEKLAFTDEFNTQDENKSHRFTLSNVDQVLQGLKEANLGFSLEPWQISAPPEEATPSQKGLHDIFRNFFFETVNGEPAVVHRDHVKQKLWKEYRLKEYHDYRAAKFRPHQRHVFVRVNGAESKMIHFPYTFDKTDSSVLREREGVLAAFQRKILEELGMPLDRGVSLGWYAPTAESCQLYCDKDLFTALHNDPGVTCSEYPTEHPPVYFVLRRDTLYFSEWAFSVKHQLLTSCPTALAASLQLLDEVKTGGANDGVMSVSESLATEFRYFIRMMRRKDFHTVGYYSMKPNAVWEEKSDRSLINDEINALYPTPQFDDVFQRGQQMEENHTTILRPKWSPATIADVSQTELAQMRRPLSYVEEGLTDIHVPTLQSSYDKVVKDTNVIGIEIVPQLGEKKADGSPAVPATEVTVKVPENVDFYAMARHPWMGFHNSWRIDGYTKGSEEYFTKKYYEAEQRLYDSKGKGQHNYWGSKDDVDGTVEVEDEEALLKDRFWGAIEKANDTVEGWAKDLRNQAETGKFNYQVDPASTEEKIYDDNYYRWFIRPGEHPNPSGVLRFGTQEAKTSTSVQYQQTDASGWAMSYDNEEGAPEAQATPAEETDTEAPTGMEASE